VIAWLEGELRERTPTRVVLDVRGVGYELHVPFTTFEVLPDEGKTVALHVHTHAREGALQLFGFATREERVAFELLLRANRVGPKLAQTLLSGISPAQLLAAIRAGDTAPLRAVPGVGAKMAERIQMELRDRVDELAAVLTSARPSQGAPEREGVAAREQALSALQNLGYPKARAEEVLNAAGAEMEDAGVESLVRSALRRLAR